MSKKFLLVMLLILGSTATYLFGIRNLREEKHREPIIIRSDASSVEWSLADLITKADMIVIGEFISAHPARWSTANGELPDNATIETVSQQHLSIFSDWVFQISQSLKGETKASVIRIRTFGGQVGQDRMIMVDEPSYDLHQTYLLFLFNNTGKSANIDPGSFYGVGSPYKISNGMATSGNDEWALEDLINYIRDSLSQTP